MKRQPCEIRKVWAYPHTEDNAGPVRWAWSCKCGRHGDSLKSEPEARAAAMKHFGTSNG